MYHAKAVFTVELLGYKAQMFGLFSDKKEHQMQYLRR